MAGSSVVPAAFRTAGAILACAVSVSLGAAHDATSAALGAQASSLRRSLEYLVVFELTQSTGVRASIADQVTIVFSDRPVEGAEAPAPLFGEDVLAEFSFSGHDFREGRLRFARRVRDRSFLDARYLRIVNHGGGAWEGRTLSVFVDGVPVLKNVPLTPLRGPAQPSGSTTTTRGTGRRGATGRST
jgi:hypothetical protein